MKRPDRKRNRLSGYDYSRDGLYFVTICVHGRTEWFGCVADGVVMLNGIGTIADEQRQWLGQQYPYVDLGPYDHAEPHPCVDWDRQPRRERA
jgi:hypothetical protein